MIKFGLIFNLNISSRECYKVLNEKSILLRKSTLKFHIIISQQLDEQYFIRNYEILGPSRSFKLEYLPLI